MDNTTLALGYALWVIVVGLTIGFFSYFSNKHKSIGALLFFVLVPTWIITAILTGVKNVYSGNTTDLYSIIGFAGLLAESLPIIILIGGITFTIKYMKFKRNRI